MASRSSAPEPGRSRPPHDFETAYETTPPWDIGRPQPAFARLADADGLVGKVLDAGCGTGEHALLAASLGHEAVGVDIASRAIEIAGAKAVERSLEVSFLRFDALHLPELGQRFDTVLDSGLFHVLEDDERPAFVQSLAAVVPSGGRYHLLCFSERQPGDWGPRRVTQQEIRASFAAAWVIDSIEPTIIETTIDPAEAQAWQVALTRI